MCVRCNQLALLPYDLDVESHSIYIRELQPVFCCICSHACGVSFHTHARVATVVMSRAKSLKKNVSHFTHTRELQLLSRAHSTPKRLSHFTHTRELQLIEIDTTIQTGESHFTHTRELQRQKLCKLHSAAIQFLSHLLTLFV